VFAVAIKQIENNHKYRRDKARLGSTNTTNTTNNKHNHKYRRDKARLGSTNTTNTTNNKHK
jgi:hypothetical protein